MGHFFNNIHYDSFVELNNEKKLTTMLSKQRKQKTEETMNESKKKFLLESRFQLMEESLSKSKVGSAEFDAILDECVNIFLEMNPDVDISDKRDSVVKYVKDSILDKELVGEFDGKKSQPNPSAWPPQGRITLRDAIPKEYLGQNPETRSFKVDNAFGTQKQMNAQPSPSGKKSEVSTSDDKDHMDMI